MQVSSFSMVLIIGFDRSKEEDLKIYISSKISHVNNCEYHFTIHTDICVLKKDKILGLLLPSFKMVLIIGFDRSKENLHLNSKDLNTNYSCTSHFVIQEALGIAL